MPIVVTLDMFSGRPNPNWVLKPTQEAEFLARLQTLPPTREKVPEPIRLGYRGLIVQPSPEVELAGTVRIYKGVVEYIGEERKDYQRRLEDWLLRTGSPFLDARLMTMAISEIDQD